MDTALQVGDQVLVVPRNGGGSVYQGAVASASDSERVIDLTIADFPVILRGDRAVLVRIDGESRLAAEAAFFGQAGRAAARFQLLSAWRVIERRIFPRFETSLRATVQAPAGGLEQDGRVVDMSEGGLRLHTRKPMTGAVEVTIHEGSDSIRLVCDVRGSSQDGGQAQLRLRFRELSNEQRRFVHRMVTALQALNEHGRNLLAS
jgi:hypothetical protein